MSLPAGVEEALGARVVSVSPVGGGSLADAFRLELDGGATAFLKMSSSAVAGSFEAEAAGLRWLAEPGAIVVPEVLGAGADWLALAWVEARDSRLDERALGRGLALVHQAGAPGFGALPAGDDAALRLGPLEMPSPVEPAWPEFYGEHRVLPVARVAAERGAIPAGGAEAIERLCERLPDVAGPAEPVARLHGDLWSGNVMTGAGGAPVLIDPAAYGGHREVDLAMLELFGSPSASFYDAYEDVVSLGEGWRERTDLWQVFPLLVHAALFGGGYGTRAVDAARRYL